MPTDYEKLREENIGRYGSETAHLAILGELYSQRTHFIFELLQNSEDAQARRVQFQLAPNALELRHDGRVFDNKDVRAVCSVCQSTNQDDPERIGRFGIGFKSVYVYASAPEIHSGSEHFAIRHYVRPEAIEAREASDGLTTLIVLPFTASKITPQTAFLEISKAFARLDATSILFLRRAERVELLIDDANVVVLERKLIAQPAPSVRVVTVTKSGETEQPWLVFDRLCALVTPSGQKISVRVEIAFAVNSDSSGENLVIRNCERTTVAVFFPTGKATGTGFLIQGPYRTTPDRSDILADDPTNDCLAKETGELVVAALAWLRDQGCLTVEVLKSLPLCREAFPDGGLLQPVFDRVLSAIKSEPLLPAHDSTANAPAFVAGSRAKAASSKELRELLPTEQLRQLAGGDIAWCWLADGLTVRGESELACYLREEIGIEEVTTSDFVNWLEAKDAGWWKDLDEEWLIRVYHYLHKQTSEHKRLRKLPIVRLASGEHAVPGEQVLFFPTDDAKEIEELASFLSELPIINKKLLVDDEDQIIESFLRQLGVSPLSTTECIRRVIIPRYAADEKPTIEVNRTHVRFIYTVFQNIRPDKEAALVAELKPLRWLLVKKASDNESLYWSTAAEAHLPQAYTNSSELETFFNALPDTRFVDSSYAQGKEKWLDFFLLMGCPRVPTQSADKHDIAGLSEALACQPTLAISNAIALSNAIFSIVNAFVPEKSWEKDGFGIVLENRYGPRGGDQGQTKVEARFFAQMKRSAWLFDSDHKLRRPCDLFEDTEQNRNLLGDAVAYMHKDISLSSENTRWLAAKLGIRTRPTKEAVLGRLVLLKSQETTSKQVLPLYEFLSKFGADVAEAFGADDLVYCPNVEPHWRAPSQCFWEDESPVFGTTRGYLRKHYSKLQDFFARSGVPLNAGPIDYLAALLRISEIGTTDDVTLARIHRIFKRLAPRLDEGGEWQSDAKWRTNWSALKNGRNWIGRTGDAYAFYQLNDLVREDNEHRAELFRASIPFWPFPDLDDFAKHYLQVTPCSEATCSFEPIEPGDSAENLTEDIAKHWVLVTAFLSSEKWKSEVLAGTEDSIHTPPSVQYASHIAVSYKLKGVTVEEVAGKAGFFEHARAIMWITQGLDRDDSVEALGDALQDFFGPENLREFVCDLFRKPEGKVREKWKKMGLREFKPAQAPTFEPEATPAEPVDLVEPSHGIASEPEVKKPLQPTSDETPTSSSRDQSPTQPSLEKVPAGSMRRDAGPSPKVEAADGGKQVRPQQPSPATIELEALEKGFNRSGKSGSPQKTPPPASIRDAPTYRTRIRKKYSEKRLAEPLAEERKKSRTVSIWEPKNSAVREFFLGEYGGRCQICDETFTRRDGRPYFEAVHLIPYTVAAWTDEPGSVLCLCGQCSAKWQHGSVESSDAINRLQRLSLQGDSGVAPTLALRLAGNDATIHFSDRHLIEIQELLSHCSLDSVSARDKATSDSAPLPLNSGPDDFVNCKYCSAKVKQRKLSGHIKRVHGSKTAPLKSKQGVLRAPLGSVNLFL